MFEVEDRSAGASSGKWWTWSDCRGMPPAEQPRVYFATPTGRDYQRYTLLRSKIQTRKREFVESEIERLDLDLDYAEVSSEIAKLQMADAVSEMDADELEGEFDEEDLKPDPAVFQIRWDRFGLTDEEIDELVDFARKHVTKLSNIGFRGQSIDWSSDEQFGEMPINRDDVLLSLGDPNMRIAHLQQLCSAIADGLSLEQKKS